jgi:hypothetical protein
LIMGGGTRRAGHERTIAPTPYKISTQRSWAMWAHFWIFDKI